eukprot:TRINITY_DN41909_c0_g1_i1.p1 TRINITY_DN41909_c0_g1~~TRINITY_DN41909_c0_g1_i1.p1  ORF type:complete len:715 (+),score=105.58 TRINITY_DN41909_c0_g1_i1:76-2220(+)
MTPLCHEVLPVTSSATEEERPFLTSARGAPFREQGPATVDSAKKRRPPRLSWRQRWKQILPRYGQLGMSWPHPAAMAMYGLGEHFLQKAFGEAAGALYGKGDAQEMSLRELVAHAEQGTLRWQFVTTELDHPEAVAAILEETKAEFPGIPDAVPTDVNLVSIGSKGSLAALRNRGPTSSGVNFTRLSHQSPEEALQIFLKPPSQWSASAREEVQGLDASICVLQPGWTLHLALPSYVAMGSQGPTLSIGSASDLASDRGSAHGGSPLFWAAEGLRLSRLAETSRKLSDDEAALSYQMGALRSWKTARRLHLFDWRTRASCAVGATLWARTSRERQLAARDLKRLLTDVEIAKARGSIPDYVAGNFNAQLVQAFQMASRGRRKAADVVRSKLQTFTISKWTGRIGNNLAQLANALAAARRVGAQLVKLPRPGSLAQLMTLPRRLWLRRGMRRQQVSGVEADPQLAKLCRGLTEADLSSEWFYRQPCASVTAGERRQALLRHAMPRLRQRWQRCIRRGGRDPGLLTIHLRSGDIFGAAQGHQQHRQPPCAMYEKIISEGRPGGYQRVLLVTDGDLRHKSRTEEQADGDIVDHSNPCIAYIAAMGSGQPSSERLSGQRGAIQVSIQRGSASAAACSVLRARNVVVAFSTFSAALALSSKYVRRVYGTDMTPLLDCDISNVAFFRMRVPGLDDERPRVSENRRWMLEYNHSLEMPPAC